MSDEPLNKRRCRTIRSPRIVTLRPSAGHLDGAQGAKTNSGPTRSNSVSSDLPTSPTSGSEARKQNEIDFIEETTHRLNLGNLGSARSGQGRPRRIARGVDEMGRPDLPRHRHAWSSRRGLRPRPARSNAVAANAAAHRSRRQAEPALHRLRPGGRRSHRRPLSRRRPARHRRDAADRRAAIRMTSCRRQRRASRYGLPRPIAPAGVHRPRSDHAPGRHPGGRGDQESQRNETTYRSTPPTTPQHRANATSVAQS